MFLQNLCKSYTLPESCLVPLLDEVELQPQQNEILTQAVTTVVAMMMLRVGARKLPRLPAGRMTRFRWHSMHCTGLAKDGWAHQSDWRPR